MVSRTYSVKFKSEGLAALVQDLKTTASIFDEVLADSQRSVDNIVKRRSSVINTSELSALQDNQAQKVKTVQSTNEAIVKSYALVEGVGDRFLASSRRQFALWIDSVTSGVQAGTSKVGSDLRNSTPRVVAFRSDESVVPRVVVVNSPFKGNSSLPPTAPDYTAKLDQRDRALVEVWRVEYRNFFVELKRELTEDLKDAIGKDDGFSVTSLISAPINFAASIIKFPFEATLLGAFSGFGETLTKDFSKGFRAKFEKGLGLSLKEVGNDVGDIVGQSVYRTYEASLKAVRNIILNQSGDKTPQVEELITDLKNILLGGLVQGSTVPIKAHKRIQLNKKGLAKAMSEAGRLMIESTPTPDEIESINSKKSITLLVGGVNGDETADNTNYVNRLLSPVLKDTHTVPFKNEWSNSKITPEFKNVIVSFLKNLLSNETLSGSLRNYLKSTGFNDSLKGDQFEKLALEHPDKLSEQIIDFFEKSNLPFGRLLESAYQGYNSDDIMLAAKALYYKQNFPDKPLNIVGTSGGGFNAAGAIEILNRLGHKDVKGLGITTPFTGLEFTGNTDNFYASLGTRDPYYQMLFGSALKGLVEPPDFLQTIEGAGIGHLLAPYVGNDEFQNLFQYFFKDRIAIPPGITPGTMNYFSRRVQYPEDENLKRTLQAGLGEQFDSGYIYDADGLAFFTQDIKKKANKIKNKDIQKEAKVFIEFLEALGEEFKVISVLGEKFKPIKSLQKAAKVYPELKKLATSYKSEESDESLKKAALAQLEANEIFIKFKAKIKSEADNIKRTLGAMRGEKVDGYAFYDDSEYETRANDHLGGLIGHLENNLLKGATPKQQAKAYKYIEYLKRLQAQILERGKGGSVDPELEVAGQNLFGFSLQGAAPPPSLQQRRAKIPKSPKQIAIEYNEYLASLSSATSEGFGFDQSDFPQVLRAIKTQLKEYRTAVANTQLEVAKNLGENLLEIIGAVRTAATNSNEVSPQTLGTLTRYQNEILKGDKGQGRAQVGLSQLALRNPDFQALLLKAQNAGSNVTKGLTLGVNQNLDGAKKSGEQLGEAVIKGAEGELEIKSPSRRFMRIGRFIVEGLNKGVQGIGEVFSRDIAPKIEEGIQETVNKVEETLHTIDALAVPVPQVEIEPETAIIKVQRQISEAQERTKYGFWDLPVTKATPKPKPKPPVIPLQPRLPGTRIAGVLPPVNENFWTISDFWQESGEQAPVKRQPRQESKKPANLPALPPTKSATVFLPAYSSPSLKQLVHPAELQAIALIKNAQDQAKALITSALKEISHVVETGQNAVNQLSLISEKEAKELEIEIQKLVEKTTREAQNSAVDLIKKAEIEAKQLTLNSVEIAVEGIKESLAPSQFKEIQLALKSALANITKIAASVANEHLPASNAPRSVQMQADIPDPWETKDLRVLITPPPKQTASPKATSRSTNNTSSARVTTVPSASSQNTNSAPNPARGKQVSSPSTDNSTPIPTVENLEELREAAHNTSSSIQTEVTDATVKAKKWFDKIFNQPGINKTIDEGLGSAIKSVGEFFGGLEQQFPILRRLKGVIAELSVNLLAMFGVFSAGMAIVQVGQAALETARKFEQLDRVIVGASGSAEKGAANLKFVGTEAKRLSLDLEAAKSAYGQLLASAQGSALEGEPINQIFSAVGEASVNKGLDKEGQSRAFLAVQQMISKGKVSAEELRQQLGEALPGTLQTAARSLGLTTQQLDKMLESGQLLATDFLPKFASQLSAENASGVSGSANTAQASITRFNNALTEFQVSLGQGLLPAQKLGLNVLSGILEQVRVAAESLIKVITSFALLLSYKLVDAFLQSVTAGKLAALGITSLKDAFLQALPAIKQLLAEFILVTAAVQTWTNVYQLTQDSFKDIADYANASASGLDKLAEAYRNASGEADNFNSKPKPKRDRDLISNAGIDFYGIKFNLDTMYRKPIDYIAEKFGGNFSTQGQREYNDFLANAGDLIDRVYQNNFESSNAKNTILDIQKIDRELEKIRSKRFDLLPGDRDGLQKSIEQEQTLLAQREKSLKVTSTIQSNFARDAENLKKTLEALKRLPEGADTDEVRTRLETALNALEQSQTGFDALISSVSRGISELDRRMRNLNEGMVGFNENLERKSAAERTNITNQGVEAGRDSSKIQFDVQRVNQLNLGLKIAALEKAIAVIERNLQSPEQSEIVQNLGIDPLTIGSKQLERMLGEGRSPAEQSALKAIQDLKGYRQQLEAATEQLANGSLQLTSTLKEFTLNLVNFYLQLQRQVEDLSIEAAKAFEQLQQQFRATQIEIETTIESSELTTFKTSLSIPLLTHAERLLNGTNDAFEQYINSLIGGLEKLFQKVTLETQLKSQLDQINNQITGLKTAQSDKIRALNRQNEDKQKEYEQLMRGAPTESSSTSPPLETATSGLTIANGLITPVVGANRNTKGGYDADTGLDIIAPVGSKVVAAASGILEYAENGHNRQQSQDVDPTTPGWQPSYSIRVKLDQPYQHNGKEYPYMYYTHLRSVEQEILNQGSHSRSGQGQPLRIQAGQSLGEVGVANKVPHLHFGIVANREQTQYLNHKQLRQLLYEGQQPFLAHGDKIRTDAPKSSRTSIESMSASWYGPGFAGNKTANGETFDPTGLTAAHKTLPFGTQLQVTNPKTGQGTTVRVNDRGPFIPGRDLDLSQGAARAIGLEQQGHGVVKVEIVNPQKADLADTKAKSNETQLPLNDVVADGVQQKLPDYTSFSIGTTQVATGQNIELLEQKKSAITDLNEAQQLFTDLEDSLQKQTRQNTLAKYIQSQTFGLEQLNDQLADLDDKYSSDTPAKKHEATIRTITAEYRSLGRQLKNQVETLNQQKDRFKETADTLKMVVIPGLTQLQQQFEAGGDTKGASAVGVVIKQMNQEVQFVERQIPKLEKLALDYQAQRDKLPAILKRAKQREYFRSFIESEESENSKKQKLSDSNNSLLESKSNLLQSRGDEFGSRRISKQRAIEGENLRYQQQEFELTKELVENPTKYTAEQVAKLHQNIDELNKINLATINEQFKDLGQAIGETSKGALTQFFESFFTGTKSAGEAFRDMALTILRYIAQVAAQQIVLNIFGQANGQEDGFLGLFKKIAGHADGGLVTGPGSDTSDSLIRRLSNGEFVVRAAAVKHWGTNFLEDLNSMRTPSMPFAALGFGQGGNSKGVSNPTMIVNVSTPDANSFRRSESQIGREAGELYRRSIMRNG